MYSVPINYVTDTLLKITTSEKILLRILQTKPTRNAMPCGIQPEIGIEIFSVHSSCSKKCNVLLKTRRMQRGILNERTEPHVYGGHEKWIRSRGESAIRE